METYDVHMEFDDPTFAERKFDELAELTLSRGPIDPELYIKYDVKRGLRDLDGRGVVVGLTEIGEVHSYILDEGEIVPVPGRLTYRGYDINDLTQGFLSEKRFGYEETIFLLLFGHLPTAKELEEFRRLLALHQNLPPNFARDFILNSPSKDIMNALARSVLALYTFDDNPDDTSIRNVLKQCVKLIASFPLLAVYSYQAYSHYHGKQSLVIHNPRPDLSLAENVLYLLRPNHEYTELEARLLDLAFVLHAEHGGGNNSSFVTHVVTSTGTDTYSAVAAALGALKGPKHGGANQKVIQMIDDLKTNVENWDDEDQVADYLHRIVTKQAFDRSGLIYGVGHAVYSISDPRCIILKSYAEKLAKEKGLEHEFKLYDTVEKLAPEVIAQHSKIYKGVCANVDFYSGFVYKMLNLPLEMYTPIFAISRISGWSAHRIEELANGGKIIRPAYKSVVPRKAYVPLGKRGKTP